MSEVQPSSSDAALIVRLVNAGQRIITLQDYLIDLDGKIVPYPSHSSTVEDKDGEHRLPRKLIPGDHLVLAYRVTDIIRLAQQHQRPNLASSRIGYKAIPGGQFWSDCIEIVPHK